MSDLLSELPNADQPAGATPPGIGAPDPLNDLPGVDTPLSQAYQGAARLDPERAAKVLDISKRLNQPEAFVDRHLDDLQKVVNSPDPTFWKQYQAQYPKAAEYLTDPKNMAVAQDDHQNLAEHEGLFAQAGAWWDAEKRAWEGGKLQEESAFLGAQDLFGGGTGVDTSARRDIIGKRLADLEAQKPQTGLLARGTYGAAEFLPQIAGGLKAGAYAGAGAGLGVAAAGLLAGPAAPAVEAFALPSFGVGFAAGETDYNFKYMAGSAYNQLRSLRDRDGNPLPDSIARPAAIATGAAQAGLGMIQVGAVMKYVPGGQAFMDAFQASVGPKALESASLSQALATFAKNYTSAVLHGTAAMTGITAVGAAGTAGAEAVSGQPFDIPTASQTLDELGKTAGDAALTFGVLSSFAPGFGLATDVYRARTRADAAKGLTIAVADAASRSKVLERLPEGYQSALGQVAAGSGAETAYIPAQDFETYFQSKKLDPKKEAERLGVGKEFDQAKESGGDILIPTENLITAYGKTEHLKGLADDVKFSPEDLTARQVKAKEEDVRNLVDQEQQAAQEAVKADASVKAGYDSVFNQVRDAILASPPRALAPKEEKLWQRQADAYATAWASRAVTESAKRSKVEGRTVTPQEWFQSTRPEVLTEDRPYRADAVRAIRDEIASGSVQSGGLRADSEGNVYGRFGTSSDYPAYFQKQGLSREEALASIDKYLAGEKLTEKQGQTLRGLYERSGYGGPVPLTQASEPFLQSAQKAPEFYSRLERAVEQKLGNKATPDQVRALARDLNKEEVQYSGLEQFLQGKEKIDKQQLLDHLRENQVQIQDITKQIGGDGGTPRYGEYTLPGGDNYREVLFTLPPKPLASVPDGYRLEHYDGPKKRDEWHVIDPEGKIAGIGKTQEEALADLQRVSFRDQQYRSSHYEERNILAHVRLDDRTDLEGKRVLMVEEIQSDWHQAGREKGYGDPFIKPDKTFSADEIRRIREEFSAKLQSVEQEVQQYSSEQRDALYKQMRENPPELKRLIGNIAPAIQEAFNRHVITLDDLKQMEAVNSQSYRQPIPTGLVPDAPFKKTWQELALKKVLRMAVEGGYDRVAWTTGEQQAERYDLSRRLDAIYYSNDVNGTYRVRATDKLGNTVLKEAGVSADKLSGIIGKDLAKKVTETSGDKTQKLEGLDLKVGGEGMKGFYDKIIPDFLRKYTKKWGGQVERGHVETPDGTAPVHSLDITPAMREAILHEGQPLFQEDQTGAPPRGQVQFGGITPAITLFKAADASTFLHESAHIWLKDVFDYARANDERLTPEYRKDFETLSEWLGITKDQTALTGDQQEQFARGFEAYLREGKAPSDTLRRVFRSLRSWLTRIYRDAKGLNVELSDPVRGVMDRLLATEDEIQQAVDSSGYKPMQVEIPGLPPEIQAKVARLQEQAHEEAVQYLLKRQMDELKAERRDQLGAERERIEKEVRAKLKDNPIYLVQQDLREELQTKKSGRVLAEQYLNGKLREHAQGIFEARAELAGYTSGDELAKAILGSDNLEAAVKKQVELRMLEHSDLRNSDAIKAEALQAIHNEQALELMGLEREILKALVFDAEVNLEARKLRTAEARVEAQAARARAKEVIAGSNIRAATAFRPFLTQERRWAETAAKKIAAKDYEGAATAKRLQMLNHALATEAMAADRKVTKWLNTLATLRTKDAQSFGQEEHFNQAAEILRRLGFERRDYNPERKQESLAQWVARMQDVTNTVNMPDWLLDEGKIKGYRDLSIEQLGDVMNALKNIQSVANFEKRSISIDKGATLDAIITDLRIASGFNGLDKTAFNPQMVEGKYDRLKGMANRYFLNLTKINTLLLKLDGFRDGGKWTKTFYDTVHSAADKESVMLREDKEKLQRVWSAYSKAELKDMVERKFNAPELGTSTTKMKILMMALNYGNEDNRAKLVGTNPVGVDKATAWGDEQVQSLFRNHMTARDWNFVQSVWDMINERWPEIAALHRELTGFAPKKVDAVPFNIQSSDGKLMTLKGGYFPLKEDVRASVRAATRAELDQPLYTEQNPAWRAATKTGHTKERTGAQYAVSLDPSIIQTHMKNVVHDLAFRPTVIDLRRLLGNEQVQGLLRENIGMDGYNTIRDWLGSVAGNDSNGGTDIMASMARGLRNSATVATIQLRPSVLLKHAFNFLLYGGDVVDGFGYRDATHAFFVRGALDYIPKTLFNWQAAEAIREQVYQKSAFMRDTHENPDLTLSETNKKIFSKDSRIQEFSRHLIGRVLESSAIPMWLEAYEKGLTEKNFEEDEAIRYADNLISRVQGSGRRLDAPGIQRGGEIGKALSMYYTFMSTEFNRFQIERGKLALDSSRLPQFLGYAASRLLMASAPALVAGGLFHSESEDETWKKKVAKEVLGYPAAMLPGVREVSSVFLDEALGLKSFGYQPSPAAAAIVAGLDTGKEAIRYAKTGDDAQRVVEAATRNASYLFPYPDQINAWLWNAYDSFVNGSKPELSDIYRRRPRKDR